MTVELRSMPIALVTGASGGIGRACCRQLGVTHRLVLADVNEAGLDSFAAQLTEEGYDVAAARAGDLSERTFVDELVASCRAMGQLRLLVHSAGLSPSQADWQAIIRVNVLATHIIVEAFEDSLTEGACAVLIASLAGHLAEGSAAIDGLIDAPDHSSLLDELSGKLDELGADAAADRANLAYTWSKRGTIRLAELKSLEWAGKGARIVSVSPGLIFTSMGRKEMAQNAVAAPDVPAGRWGSPNDVAAAVDFLASDRASYITGTDLRVDGGATPVMLNTAPVSRPVHH